MFVVRLINVYWMRVLSLKYSQVHSMQNLIVVNIFLCQTLNQKKKKCGFDLFRMCSVEFHRIEWTL